MPTALTLLDGVAWQGQAVPGDRVAALLATLASTREAASRSSQATRPEQPTWLRAPPGSVAVTLRATKARSPSFAATPPQTARWFLRCEGRQVVPEV